MDRMKYSDCEPKAEGDRNSQSTPQPMNETNLGVLGWLERIFFGGMELSVLSTPAFAAVLVVQTRYPDAVPLAGLTAIAAGSLAIALFRAQAIDVGAWPRPSELTSLPLRVTYFSVLFVLASVGVAAGAVAVGSWGLTAMGGVVQAAGLAAFPTVYRRVHGTPQRNPASRL